MSMHTAALLAKDNHDLRAANERQKQKRTRRGRGLGASGVLTLREAREIATNALADQDIKKHPVICLLLRNINNY